MKAAFFRRYGPPVEIALELARELKLDEERKKEINRKNRENREAAEKRSTKLREIGQADKGGNRAIRYGVGVGRDGFRWGGIHKISRKQEWPDWTPPPEMIQRQPYLPRFMAGGPGNPMGARALYIGTTVYRVHGTNAPETIGHAVSSGCFRLVNSEIEDLYERVPVGTKIVVQHR